MYITFHQSMKHKISSIIPVKCLQKEIQDKLQEFTDTYKLQKEDSYPMESNGYYLFIEVSDKMGAAHRIDVDLS